MKSTPPKIATCPRCGNTVMACMVDGYKVAVDPSVVGFSDVRYLLTTGSTLYRLLWAAGRPCRLQAVTAALLKSPSAQRADYVAAHACGASALSVKAFEVGEVGVPPRASGQTPACGEPEASKAVQSVTNRNFDEDLPAIRCGTCSELIPRGEPNRIQVRVPVWQSEMLTVHARGKGKQRTQAYERRVDGWGWKTWAIHPDGCPAKAGRQSEPRST